MSKIVRLTQVFVLVSIVVIWEILSYFNIVSRFILPGPYVTGVTLLQLLAGKHYDILPHGIYPQLATTLTEIAGAIGLSAAIGLSFGFAIGMNRTVADVYEPILYVLYAIPGIVLYPVIYLLVGIGEPSKILFGAFLGVWVLAINTIAGLRQIKPQYFRLSKSLKLSRSGTIFKVVIPAAAPNIISGFRLAIALSIIGVIAGEILASNRGVGYIITATLAVYDVNITYAAILLVLAIGFALVEVSRLVERRFLAHAP